MKKPKSDYVIQTVTNALSLLEAFRGEEEVGVTELSRRLGLHKNNVFRLLATLEQKAYIEQSSNSDRYRLGVRCLELGQSFGRNRSIMREARSVLESLTDETREASHLGVLRNFEVVHLDGEQPNQLVSTGSRVGARLPAHCTALGKVLLGCADESVRELYDREWVAPQRLESRTARTIRDREKLFEQLRSVASQGYAVDIEECAAGLSCVAAPVHDATGCVVAALSVSAPSFRMHEGALLRDVLPSVTAWADRLSAQIGYLA